MERAVSPLGHDSYPSMKILHSGSFPGNPVSLAAGLAMIGELERLNPYSHMENITQEYKGKVSRIARDLGLKVQINALGSFFQTLFTDSPIRNKRDVMKADKLKQHVFSIGMTVNGVVIIPAHPCLMSNAHTEEDIRSMVEISGRILTQLASSERQEPQLPVTASHPL